MQKREQYERTKRRSRSGKMDTSRMRGSQILQYKQASRRMKQESHRFMRGCRSVGGRYPSDSGDDVYHAMQSFFRSMFIITTTY